MSVSSEGVVNSRVHRVGDVDSKQALLLAIRGIRVQLDLKAPRSSFLGLGPDSPLGLPDFSDDKRAEERILFAGEREALGKWRGLIKSRRAGIRVAEATLRKQNGKKKAQVAARITELKTYLPEWPAEIRKLKPGWSRPSRKHIDG